MSFDGPTSNIGIALGLAASLILLSACQRSEDPAKAGFFDGAANLIDGTYEERQTTLQSEAATKESQADVKAREAEALRNESELLAAEERVLRRQVAELDRNLEALRLRLAKGRTEAGADQAALAALEMELNELEAQRRAAGSGGGVTAEEIALLRLEEDELRRSIDQLLEIQTTIE